MSVSMSVISQPDWTPQPWKNGGGTTHEIWRVPERDDYDLRISLATVEAAGPFSKFPGYRRWLFLVGAAPIELVHDQTIKLLAPGDHVELPGETQITANLSAGPTKLLNILVKTGEPRVIGYGPVAHPVHYFFAMKSKRGGATHPQLARWDSVVFKEPVATDTTDAIWIA